MTKRKKTIKKRTSRKPVNNRIDRKKSRLWLRGGKLGAIVGLLVCLISILVLLSYNNNCGEFDNCMMDAPNHVRLAYDVFSSASYPLIEFINLGLMDNILFIILGVLILILEYFIAGAVIGYIVDKIRKDKDY
ncbi:hypothetical protein GOV12_01025 [Candidatus Pacearchaeota archaeon]|nr:hypothetical protein [Candidatus Pacearchaeota archaeon]